MRNFVVQVTILKRIICGLCLELAQPCYVLGLTDPSKENSSNSQFLRLLKGYRPRIFVLSFQRVNVLGRSLNHFEPEQVLHAVQRAQIIPIPKIGARIIWRTAVLTKGVRASPVFPAIIPLMRVPAGFKPRRRHQQACSLVTLATPAPSCSLA